MLLCCSACGGCGTFLVCAYAIAVVFVPALVAGMLAFAGVVVLLEVAVAFVLALVHGVVLRLIALVFALVLVHVLACFHSQYVCSRLGASPSANALRVKIVLVLRLAPLFMVVVVATALFVLVVVVDACCCAKCL